MAHVASNSEEILQDAAAGAHTHSARSQDVVSGTGVAGVDRQVAILSRVRSSGRRSLRTRSASLTMNMVLPPPTDSTHDNSGRGVCA